MFFAPAGGAQPDRGAEFHDIGQSHQAAVHRHAREQIGPGQEPRGVHERHPQGPRRETGHHSAVDRRVGRRRRYRHPVASGVPAVQGNRVAYARVGGCREARHCFVQPLEFIVVFSVAFATCF